MSEKHFTIPAKISTGKKLRRINAIVSRRVLCEAELCGLCGMGMSKAIMKISKMLKHHGVFYFLLLALSIGISGCGAPKPKPNLLAGWSISRDQDPNNYSKAIIADYKAYIQKLSEDVRSQIVSIWFLENWNRQNAVKIEIPINGTFYDHLLISDQNNVRTNTVVFVRGRYSS